MPSLQEVAYRLYGACRLLRGDRGGMAFFDGQIESFWKSFFAAALVAPAYLIAAGQALGQGEPVGGAIHSFAVFAVAYVVIWTAFPVAFHALADLIDRRGRYTLLIVAFNWSQAIKMLLHLPILVFGAVGLMSKPTADTLSAFVTLAMLWYQWFVIKTALEVSGTIALLLVALDIALQMAIASYVNQLIF